jgi:hypothetical protein
VGQMIECRTVVVGDMVVVATDRSLTGQTGAGFDSLEEASAAGGFGATLAARLFSADSDLGHVFVASNQVMVTRIGGWDETGVETITRLVRELFAFYGS